MIPYGEISDDDDDDNISVEICNPDYEYDTPGRYKVCQFISRRSGCRYGAFCKNKHLTENGACLRCHKVLRLADVQRHFRQTCELRYLRAPSETVQSNGDRLVTESRADSRRPLPNRNNRFTVIQNRSDLPSLSPTPADSFKSRNCLPSSSSSFVSSSFNNSSNPLWKGPTVCRYYLKGACVFGEHCMYRHQIDDKCVLCEKAAACDHWKFCKEYQQIRAEIKKTSEVDCPICFTRLSEIPSPETASGSKKKPAKTTNRFALLPNCGHIFCLKCITSWRNEKRDQSDSLTFEDYQEGRYLCPLCRKEARFIIPCNRVIEGSERCKREQAMFVHNLKPCRYFSNNRRCKHGSECPFAHMDSDGLPVAPRNNDLASVAAFREIISESFFHPSFAFLSAIGLSPDSDDSDHVDSSIQILRSLELLGPSRQNGSSTGRSGSARHQGFLAARELTRNTRVESRDHTRSRRRHNE